jgi:hypothetical protein
MKQLEELEELLTTVLSPEIKQLIETRSAFYSELANGYGTKAFNMALRAYKNAINYLLENK